MRLTHQRRKRGRVVAAACAVLASLSPASVGLTSEPSQGRSAGEPSWMVAASLPTVGGTWTELTALPYDLEDPKYRAPEADQFLAGSGYGFAGGRIQALADRLDQGHNI